ncbi:MAG: protein kinase, partial [Deltaproteobacteria bacterium]|nr:protein kinase [Deltaproteobacteria bacterium]
MSTVFGKYEFIERLGLGGMAEVFLARTKGVGGFEKQLAIKRLLPQYTEDQQTVDLLADEARITVKLTHPNIVQVYDFGQVDDAYFIAMEYIDGLDLKTLVQIDDDHSRPLPLDVALHVTISLLEGLDFAHKRKDELGDPLGIIHRDVSPHNVLISRQGQIKLTDFGVARARISVHVSVVGDIRGKFSYMPPEQACGGEIDQRVDIFAAGAILYELLCGVQPFRSTSTGEQMKLLTSKVAPPSSLVSGLPESLDAATLRSLATNPADRFESAHDFAEELRHQLHALGADRMAAQQSLIRLVDERYAETALEDDNDDAPPDPFEDSDPGGDFIFPDQIAAQAQTAQKGEIEERPETLYDDDGLRSVPSVSFSDALLHEAARHKAEQPVYVAPDRSEDRTAVVKLHDPAVAPATNAAAMPLAYAKTAIQMIPPEVAPRNARERDSDPTRIRFNPLGEEPAFAALSGHDVEDAPTARETPASAIDGPAPRVSRTKARRRHERMQEEEPEDSMTAVQIGLPEFRDAPSLFASTEAPEHLSPDDALLALDSDHGSSPPLGKPTFEVPHQKHHRPEGLSDRRKTPDDDASARNAKPDAAAQAPKGRYAMSRLPSESRDPEAPRAHGTHPPHDQRSSLRRGDVSSDGFTTTPQEPLQDKDLQDRGEARPTNELEPPKATRIRIPSRWLGWALIGSAVVIGIVIAI